ncbi:MAG: hypothetical protein BroJett040_00640 [Oligoflexia bacterium]|nr:MAG: hypothetical protein BroJett040_00640 [Oligoflexia bacterium]
MGQKNRDDSEIVLIAVMVFGMVIIQLWRGWGPIFIDWYFRLREIIIIFLSGLTLWLFLYLKKELTLVIRNHRYEQSIADGKSGDSVYAGRDESGHDVYINLTYRRMHAQIVGTTNAGKTESVIVPWVVDDIQKGRGLILVDGKSDKTLLNKLYAYAVASNRQKDFRVFSLSDYGISQTFNPLIQGTVDEVAEKVIHSFQIENEYYRTLQFDVFRNVLAIFRESKEYPTFLKIRQAISDPAKLQVLAEKTRNPLLIEWATEFLNTNKETRKEQISGLLSNLGYFTSGEVGPLFNVKCPSMSISQVMNESLIAFFQLPVLKSPMLGKAVAKMVLQDIQSSVSIRHASGKEDHPFVGVYLDDFTEYLTKSFVSVLNKSRSANVGVTFAHQAIGDLEGLGQEVKNQIQTNTNLKVFMRTNEPESAEYFSKTIGTKQSQKHTLRQKSGIFGTENTGEASVRDVEEFIIHPNVFKSDLGKGEAIIVLPHDKGAKSLRVKFEMRPNLKSVEIPEFYKPNPDLLTVTGEGPLEEESNMEEKRRSVVGEAIALSQKKTLKKEAA